MKKDTELSGTDFASGTDQTTKHEMLLIHILVIKSIRNQYSCIS